MGFLTAFKAQKAMGLQRKGNKAEAMKLYEEVFAEGGISDIRYVLAYALLLLRDGQFQKAKDLLVKYQKMPGMSPESRVELIIDYAVCVHKLGQSEKAVAKLEELYHKNPTGLLYQVLGYLYVEKYDLKNRPDENDCFPEPVETVETPSGAETRSTEEITPEDIASAKFPSLPVETVETPVKEEKPATPLEAWTAGREAAKAFVVESIEYDDEDPVLLDNMAQILYRCYGDKAGAKEWFLKALKQKDNQIDTLWFLSRYDLEEGNTASALERLETASEGRFSPLNYVTKQDILDEIQRLKK